MLLPTKTRFIQELAAKYWTGNPVKFDEASELPVAEFFGLLEDYYLNNGLYWLVEQVLLQNRKSDFDNRRPIRNPAHAAVEFYAGKLWPGPIERALPVITDNQGILDPIKQIYQWSNWGQKKQTMSRKLAMFGTNILKVNLSKDRTRVYLQIIDPRVVPDEGFTLDERGFLTYIRMDIPQQVRNDKGKEETEWWTEVWDKLADGSVQFRLYIHKEGDGADIDKLGDPVVVKVTGEPSSVDDADAYLPFDFIPIVMTPFRDVGLQYGIGCFVHTLDKIDEANLLATRLHSLIYNTDAIWALEANARDAQGRPMPAPAVDGQDNYLIKIGSLRLIKLPGTSKLTPLVPDLNFDALSKVVSEMVREVERDLPEARYYRLTEQGGELSGRAIEMLLGDAIDRVIEARGNGEEAIKRALQMALSLGVAYGVFPGTLGNFAAGSFELSFRERPVITPTLKELFEVVKLAVDSGVTVEVAMQIASFTDEVVASVTTGNEEAAQRNQANLASAVLNAMNQNTNTPPIGQEDTNPIPNDDVNDGE